MRTIRFISIALLSLVLAGLRTVCAFAAELPNVLIVMSDDHAAYVSGAYGNKKARTPNIDRLARSGVRFTHAFVNCPMCTASRQSLITGRMPHDIGVTQLRTPLGDAPVTLAELLNERGYDTAAFGKMHFNSNRTHGFDRLLDMKDHRAFLKKNPPKPVPSEIDVLPQWKPFRDPASVWLNGMYDPFGAYDEDMAGTWFARQGQQFLRDHRDSETPFFLIVSFYEPHSPFRFPIEYSDSFDPESFDVPEIGPEDDWQIPEIFRDMSREDTQRINASYYTSTQFMDKNAGLVLDELDECGLSGNTLVIYLGDHGYSLGHHGRFEKHTSFEESVNAPLIMRLPQSPRQEIEVDSFVEFIDIFPTVAEFCEAKVPSEVEGRSLLPLLHGKICEERASVFCEYYENEEAMIRNKQFKFIYSTGKRERQDGYKTGFSLPGRTRILFDLQNDPKEMTNLAGRAEFQDVIADFEDEMLRRFQSHPAAKTVPAGLTDREDRLDWFLHYREENDPNLPKR